jgi:hypothetical protein
MYSSGGGGFYDHEIDGSLRFDDGGSHYLSGGISTTVSTYTVSFWFKRSTITSGNYQYMFSTRSNGGISIGSTAGQVDEIYVYNAGGGDVQYLGSGRKFRDPSAWYHLVMKVSSGSATVYINGEQLGTATAGSVNSSAMIGQYSGGGSFYFDGYIAEFNFIDGSALNPTSFGETKSGVWVPKAYEGSYGTNGFHLEFAGNTNDSSGNGNNWTAHNISSYDYVPDSPTNNFAVLNPLWRTGNTSQGWFSRVSSVTVSQGNLQQVGVGGDVPSGMPATMAVPSSGKYYWEIRHVVEPSSSISWFGVVGDNYSTIQTASNTPGRGFTSGEISMIGFDADNGRVKFGKNGTWYDDPAVSTDGTATTDSVVYLPFGAGNSGGSTHNMVFNFGQDSTFVGGTTAGGNSDANGIGDFKYSVPSGYLALCTANLTVPEAIDPAEDNSPQDYFSTLLYTGNGSSTRNLTGVGFAPDLGWFKNRTNGSRYHMIADTTRGANKQWFTNEALAQESDTTQVKGFLSDGYTLGNNSNVNQSGSPHIVWNWKADNNFMSMSTYTGNASTNNITVGVTDPDMVIFKGLTNSSTGTVMSDKMFGSWAKPLYLSSTYAGGNESPPLGVSGNTVTVYSSYGGSWNDSGVSYILYAFKEVEGHSKFGSYTGNGSTDGSFVYTGFKPAFVMVKSTSTSEHWNIPVFASDFNGTVNTLSANLSNTERTMDQNPAVDFTSNGFKIRTSDANYNSNGGNYAYMAFAELPFKYANAR